MTEPTTSTYDVVLLAEQPLSELDARQVRGLHQDLPDPVRYHVLMPVRDAAARVETAMGSLATGDAIVAAPGIAGREQVEQMEHDVLEQARTDLRISVHALQLTGAHAGGSLVTEEPVSALVDTVRELGAAEVIVLTRPHVVSEIFHLDWTSRARRKLGVPVLHLLEHETINEQSAGGGEGVTGL